MFLHADTPRAIIWISLHGKHSCMHLHTERTGNIPFTYEQNQRTHLFLRQRDLNLMRKGLLSVELHRTRLRAYLEFHHEDGRFLCPDT